MSTQLKAVALANNAGAILVWVWDEVIDECLGFSIRRIDKKTGTKTVLTSKLVRFKGATGDPAVSDTDTHPIQGCKWTDSGAEEGGTYQWEIVPRLGKPGNLRDGNAVLTNEVTMGVDYGPFVKACFNRGHLVSTQWLADALPRLPDGSPDPQGLIDAINNPDSAIAKKLGASLPAFTKLPIEEAKRLAGHVYSLFYELSAPAFVKYLRENEAVWSLVLGNSGKDDLTNKQTRADLHADGADVTDRFMPDSGIAHNKSSVVVDADGKPVKWMLQSANPTPTGYYTQANHALMIESPELAALGLDYWQRTKADCAADPIQSAEYRAANAVIKPAIVLPDGTEIQALFSPSSQDRLKPKNKPGQRTFPLLDLAVSTGRVKEELLRAKQGIYFLAFYPGFPSFLDVVTWMQNKRPGLFIRGAVSSGQALPREKSGIDGVDHFPQIQPAVGHVPQSFVPKQVAMYSSRRKAPTIIAAAALENGWEDWHKELLKLPDAHAIIHSKVIVVDPFGEDPRILGAASDNLGLKAGMQNDETTLVIRGNRRLVQAYFVHIMDVYSHFMWRYLVATGQSTFKGELATTPTWQKKYLSGRTHDEYASWVNGVAR